MRKFLSKAFILLRRNFYIVFWGCSFFVLLFAYNHLEKVPFLRAVPIFVTSLNPICNVNFCSNKYINFNSDLLISAALFATLIFLVSSRDDIRKGFIRITIFSLILIAAGQFNGKIRDFSSKESGNFNYSLDEKRSLAFKKTYPFIKELRKNLPQACRGKVVSDLDSKSEDGMTYFRQFAYFLYPIDIRVNPDNQNPECLIFFEKENAAALVPEGYTIVYQQNKKNLAALKK